MNTDSPLTTARQFTRKLARSHYENFVVTGVLLPRELHQPFYDVYAFCRMADDASDETDSPDEALHQLALLWDGLESIYSGVPSEPLFIALKETIERFEIPRQPFEDLLDAFTQDQSVNRYECDDDLLDYCQRSANPVGRIVLTLVQSTPTENLERSDAICTGLQLVNFWQDVARDFQKGRIYLPRSRWPDEFSELEFASASTPDALKLSLQNACQWASEYFDQGETLADDVPDWFADSLRMFILGGRETIRAIERIDYDVLRVRPTVPKWKQAWWTAKLIRKRLLR